ncbi:MAG: aminopeptidase N [Succinivibrio sp.]
MEKTTYKAQKRTDYKAPDFTADEIALTFELDDEATRVVCSAKYRRLTQDKKASLVLDGEELKLVSVKLDGVSCKYKINKDKLEIANVPDEFELTVENIINPTENTSLMGLYKSDGAFCTQCEPQGFRRITYFLDRSDVLAKYRVTIVGPEYGCGVLLSNGNLIEEGTKKGRPYAVWEDPFPKPSYLFALVAGTFDIISDSYTTKSGRKVDLKLYVDRGAYGRGLWAMESIKESMRWDENRFGLEYDLDNFKVVAVDFFNFGAMENKSLNVFNSVYVMVDPTTATDTAFFNVQSVIGHEYFHNYTGDRVTLRDWFELSLKESLTVFRDQEFSSDVASRPLTRLHAINVIRGPQFAEDASPMAHPVRPEEVMEMNNFYTVTIYDKGAEVIRMIHTLIGEVKFREALSSYLTRFDGQAVTIEDFLSCMEEVGQIDLTQFRRWYTQAGTPNVKAQWRYDKSEGRLHLELSQYTKPTRGQSEKLPFFMPIRLSFLDGQGQNVHPSELNADGYIILKDEKQEFTFTLGEDCLPVLLRDFSAPVKLDAPYTDDDLQHMISFCDDAFIKVDSAQTMQRRYVHDNLIKAKAKSQLGNPEKLISSYRALLESVNKKTDLLLLNETLKIMSVSSLMETFDENIDIDAIAYAHDELEKKVACALEEQFRNIYRRISAQSDAYSVIDMARRSISNASLHMLCVSMCARGDRDSASSLVEEHYRSSKNMTDRLQALTDAVHLSLGCASELLKKFEADYSKDALAFDNYFRVQATVPSVEAVKNVKTLMSHRSYDGNNPNRVRALPGALALSNPVALHDLSGEGYDLLCQEVKRLNSVNASVAARILTPLLSFRRLDGKRQGMIREHLEKLMTIKSISRSIYEKVQSALRDK